MVPGFSNPNEEVAEAQAGVLGAIDSTKSCTALALMPRVDDRLNLSPIRPVSVVGNATIDEYLIGLPAWPTKPGTRFAYQEKKYRLGGNATTVSIALAAMCKVDVRALVGIGHGGHGQAMMSAFQGKPVTGGVPPLVGSIHCENANPIGSGASTGTTTIRLDTNGEPEFITCPGANAMLNCAFLNRRFDAIAASRHLHIGGIGNVLVGINYSELDSFLREVRKKNPQIVISLDVVLPSEQAAYGQDLHLQLFSVLKNVDYFLPNVEEAYLFAGIEIPRTVAADEGFTAQAARRFNHAVRLATIIKRGSAGVSVHTRAGHHYDVAPDRPVPIHEIVDSVGAGDTWDAGFIAARLLGHDMRNSCRVANRVAASCIRALGTTAGIRPFQTYCAGINRNIVPEKVK